MLSSDQDGVGYFRSLNPHLCLDDPGIKIEIRLLSDMTIPLLDERYLKQFNVICYNKIIPFQDQSKEDLFYDMCKRNGTKIIYDIDDYWVLDHTHLNYKSWKDSKSQEKIESLLKKADAITTTTKIFANRIKELNPNTYVLENAININENQWLIKKEPSEKIRFMWGGGISHQVDLRMVQGSFKKFDKEFLSKTQFYLCGFDLRVKHQDGRMGRDDPKRSQWTLFENLFTNSGMYITNMEHREFLNTYDNTAFGYKEEFKDEWYQRRWTKAILEYGTMYDEADVCLAPLKNNHGFNLMKSQLKIIESGCKKMPIILSKYGPYLIDEVEKNGIGVYVDEDKKDCWYDKMKWFVNNPSAIKEMGEANYEYFLKHFEMSVINKKRAQLYKDVAAGIKSDI